VYVNDLLGEFSVLDSQFPEFTASDSENRELRTEN
jgi:hypothetical protein